MPKQVIEGVLHKGSKMIISGSSKAGKTLSLLHLGLAVANGEPWLGHNTHKEGSKVIYLDFELKAPYGRQKDCRDGKSQSRL